MYNRSESDLTSKGVQTSGSMRTLGGTIKSFVHLCSPPFSLSLLVILNGAKLISILSSVNLNRALLSTQLEDVPSMALALQDIEAIKIPKQFTCLSAQTSRDLLSVSPALQITHFVS